VYGSFHKKNRGGKHIEQWKMAGKLDPEAIFIIVCIHDCFLAHKTRNALDLARHHTFSENSIVKFEIVLKTTKKLHFIEFLKFETT
jgi:hypothetical protein